MQRISAPNAIEPRWYDNARQNDLQTGLDSLFPFRWEKYQYAVVDATTNWHIPIAT